MTLATLKRIATLAEGGATVIGMKPEGSPGLNHDQAAYAALIAKLWAGGDETIVGNGRVIASKDVESAMARIGVGAQFHYSGAQAGSAIPFVQRKLADGESFFIVNQKDRTETIEARFRVTGKIPEIWHAETGKSAPVSYRIEGNETVVPLTLATDESLHIVFRKPSSVNALIIKNSAPKALAKLDGSWMVNFQPGRSAPASATLPMLKSLSEHAEPGIKHFSGMATYSKSFTAPKGWKAGQKLWLDLGEVSEMAEVTINGRAAGAVWHAPYRLDISGLAKAGQNKIEVRVANTWLNRLIGDASLPADKRITWHAGPGYNATAKLRPSGLIGPVTLSGEAK